MNTNSNQDCEVCQRIELCREGSNSRLVTELASGYVVLGDSQFFEGYCLFLFKSHVENIQDLDIIAYQRYVLELREVGAALQIVTGCLRVNYELLGNSLHHVHWHLFPRRSSDPVPAKPVWIQMPDERELAKYEFSPMKHGGLIDRLRREIHLRVATAEGSKSGLRSALIKQGKLQQDLFNSPEDLVF